MTMDLCIWNLFGPVYAWYASQASGMARVQSALLVRIGRPAFAAIEERHRDTCTINVPFRARCQFFIVPIRFQASAESSSDLWLD